MNFPVCDHRPAEDGFYSQCAGCLVGTLTAGCSITQLPDGTYEHTGITPEGGVRALFVFTNDEGDLVQKENATHLEVREFDAAGNVLSVKFGIIDPLGFYSDAQ